ncbi:type I-F CRISPR-associated protein Csy2 [Shewanella sp. AS16]|uniref:type I-F CRISPR-associated protein Csy2 n=1 Tax=Shewanella sp. AS16 TaxID=2907625 RepID=UPI001F46C274|nr:type I-F CRISPR-associated protein Csy2 [Shewanella sp. AS16]MCE9686511.1 type I-F CRISPR-associated protein Csy2 [Shewanella sp. AS16]
MSQYLVLSHVKVQNANSIAGFTWGFPAITQFLGLTHALNRKFSSKCKGSYQSELSGCAVIANHADNKVYQPKPFGDFEFLQSKNPPVLARHKNTSPPIIEEGKVNLTVSLVIELSESLVLTTEQATELEHYIGGLCRSMRMAGGTVLDIAKVKLLSASTEEQKADLLTKIKRLTMPGFVLKDRHEYLKQHSEALIAHAEAGLVNPLLDAWLDFSALKYTAQAELSDKQTEPDETTNANWKYQAKPFPGFLVPLMTGYKAISEVYGPGQVGNLRDQQIPARFVESVHSIGEWLSMHRVADIKEFIWRYYQDGDWYLCQQKTLSTADSELCSDILATQSQAEINQQILNLF